MPRVIVTNETSHDFRPAAIYGEVEFLTHRDLNNNRGSALNDELIREIGKKLIDFDPEEDFLVIAGSPYVSAATFLLLGYYGIRSLKVLRYDNRDRSYQPLYLELPDEV